MRKVLLITYFYTPHKGVGAFRMKSLAKYLPEFGYSVEVLTATPQPTESRKVKHVSDIKLPSWLFQWFPIKDQGLFWLTNLLRATKEAVNSEMYEAVIVTGPPFFHFGIGWWLKRWKPDLRLVLDFRDPFANNPRRDRKAYEQAILNRIEAFWCRYADDILVVTEEAASLISTADRSKMHVIPNGYDDDLVGDVLEKEPEPKSIDNSFIYAGKLTSDRSPISLLKALHQLDDGSHLVHFGELDNSFDSQIDSSIGNKYSPRGVVDYRQVLREIYRAEVGVVICTGVRFEPTTKIYDYIGLKLPILLIGAPQDGAATKILEDYELYERCGNTESEVLRGIKKLRKKMAEKSVSHTLDYGRRNSTALLCQSVLNK